MQVRDAHQHVLARAPQTQQDFLRYLGEALSELGATNGAWFGLEHWALDEALYWVVQGQDGWSTIPVIPPNVRVWLTGAFAHTLTFTSPGLLSRETRFRVLLSPEVRVVCDVLGGTVQLWRLIQPARAP